MFSRNALFQDRAKPFELGKSPHPLSETFDNGTLNLTVFPGNSWTVVAS